METLKEIIPKINEIKTNMDGSKKSYGNLNLLDLYNIAEPKIAEICSKYNITNFELPKISGYNSLVIYADNSGNPIGIASEDAFYLRYGKKPDELAPWCTCKFYFTK